MARMRRFWSKPMQRFVSAFVVFGALFVPVVWWVFPSSLFHATLYWLVCAITCGVVYTWDGEGRMDRLFRKLPWWRD
jgi:hypothetical protein